MVISATGKVGYPKMNVQLKKDFATSVRRQLDRYPVWEPGAPFELGAYGVLRDRTLHKLVNIREFGVAFSVLKVNETPYLCVANC